MTDKLIVATEIPDEERRGIFWAFLLDYCPDLELSQFCEIDTSTWDDDAWKEWENQLTENEILLDTDFDKVVIWRLANCDITRQTLGHW